MFVSERKRLVATDFISLINHMENKSDFENLPWVNEHGLQDFYLIISKMIQGRRTILVIFCILFKWIWGIWNHCRDKWRAKKNVIQWCNSRQSFKWPGIEKWLQTDWELFERSNNNKPPYEQYLSALSLFILQLLSIHSKHDMACVGRKDVQK